MDFPPNFTTATRVSCETSLLLIDLHKIKRLCYKKTVRDLRSHEFFVGFGMQNKAEVNVKRGEYVDFGKIYKSHILSFLNLKSFTISPNSSLSIFGLHNH